MNQGIPSKPWTIKRLLEWTGEFFARKGVQPARLSAELLLAHVLGVGRIQLYTGYDRVPTEAQLAAFRELVRRASEQEPIAYLTGRAHFFNLEFFVNSDVLIPRPDTETLVEHVLQLARHDPRFVAPRVLDLCTGSGCVAVAIAYHLKGATVLACDISAAAIAVARKNIERHGLEDRVMLERGDLYEPLSRHVDAQPFDLIVGNPPYIPTANLASLDRSVRDYEPHIALDGGPDGLTIHRRILQQLDRRLLPGGRVLLEIQFDQGESARALAEEFPFLTDIRILRDYGGNDRVLTATRKQATE